MFSKSSMKAIPLAAAMTAALMFGAAAHAQTNTTTAPGNSNMPARSGGDASNTSGNPGATSQTVTPGTEKGKYNVSPAPMAGDHVSPVPMAGNAKDADTRTMAKSDKKSRRAAKRAARKAKSMDGSARNNSDAGPQPVSGLGAVSPSPSK